MLVQPYVFFDGRCEEAVNYYVQHLGAKVEMLMRYSESPDAPPPGMVAPNSENKIMHCSFRIGDSIVMASDGGCFGKPKFEGFSLAISVNDEATAKRCFAALSEGGQVEMPLGQTFFSQLFAMVVDKFGVHWMINMV